MGSYRHILYDDPAAFELIARETGVRVDPERDRAFGSYRDDVLLGAVAFTDINGHSCAIHMAGIAPGWMTRAVIWSAFFFPFEVLRLKVVFAYLSASNERALRIDVKLGFNEAARVPDVFEDGDLVILSMYKHECKHLDMRACKET